MRRLHNRFCVHDPKFLFLFGAAGAKTVLGSEIGEDSMSLFLPGGTVLSCGVSTQKDAYYRISFRDRLCAADDQASALTLLFGDENLSGARRGIHFSFYDAAR